MKNGFLWFFWISLYIHMYIHTYIYTYYTELIIHMVVLEPSLLVCFCNHQEHSSILCKGCGSEFRAPLPTVATVAPSRLLNSKFLSLKLPSSGRFKRKKPCRIKHGKCPSACVEVQNLVVQNPWENHRTPMGFPMIKWEYIFNSWMVFGTS